MLNSKPNSPIHYADFNSSEMKDPNGPLKNITPSTLEFSLFMDIVKKIRKQSCTQESVLG
jgi:hypothetical protein